MKTIAYIDRDLEINPYFQYVKDNPASDILCIASNAATLSILLGKGVNCVPITKYQKEKEYHESEQAAFILSDIWYRDKAGKDLIEFKGISLGKALKYVTKLFFNSLIKAVHNVNNILNQEKPVAIILIDYPKEKWEPDCIGDLDIYKKVFKYFSGKKNCQIISIPQNYKSLKKSRKDHWILRNFELLRLCFFFRNIIFRIQRLLLKILKGLVVLVVDNFKSFCWLFLDQNTIKVRALVVSASDVSHLGKQTIGKILSSSQRVLYYLEHEMNCYFRMRIRRAENPPFFLIKQKEKLFRIHNQKIHDTHNILKNLAKSKPDFNLKGILLFELCDDFFDLIFKKEIPSLLRFLGEAQKTLHSFSINILLTTNNHMPKTIILAQLSIQKDMSVFYIPHGHNYGVLESDKRRLVPHIDILKYPPYYTHEAVGLKCNYHLLKKMGTKEEKLVFTGIPGFEVSLKDRDLLRRKWRAKLGFGENEDVLLVGAHFILEHFDNVCRPTQPDSFDFLKLNEELISLFARRPGSKLIFAFRPNDILIQPTCKMVEKKGLSNVLIFPRGAKLLLASCDGIITRHSNIGIEALYFNIPVLQYQMPWILNSFPLSIDEKAVIKVRNMWDLSETLDKLKNDKNFRENQLAGQNRFLKENLPDDNLEASERVVKAMERLAIKKHN